MGRILTSLRQKKCIHPAPHLRSLDVTSPPPSRGGGGNGVSGGGPAYSGSTADAACLLATLPQRMLDRESMQSAPKCPPRSIPSIPVVSPPQAGQGGQPVRVQASGRRGPRGQSRFKGVCITRAGKWRAVIYIGRKQKYLGVFDSEYDAARAYDSSALQHFAEGAKLNFPEGIEQQSSETTQFSVSGASPGGAGGPAAARSCTPPSLEQGVNANVGSGRKRNRKSTFIDNGDDCEWIRDDGPWKRR